MSRTTTLSVLLTGLFAATLAPGLSAQGIDETTALGDAEALLRSLGFDPKTGQPLQEGENDHNDHHGLEGATAPAPQVELTLAEIMMDTDVWPAEVVLIEPLRFSDGTTLGKGTILGLEGFENGDLVALHRNGLFRITPGFTDVVERAKEIASGRAQRDGFAGRFPEQLAGRAEVITGRSNRKANVEDLAGADVYLLYFGSAACGWCSRFYPDMIDEVEELQEKYSGKIKLVHASMPVPRQAYTDYVKKLGADAALPPGDQYFSDAMLRATQRNRLSIQQPSLMVVNVSGRVIDYAMREGRSMNRLEGIVDNLSDYLESPEKVRPDWVGREPAPIAPATRTLEPTEALGVNAVAMTDLTLTGPIPYETVVEGQKVPSLVLYQDTGSIRVPALVVQKVEDAAGVATYSLAFREIIGPASTGMSKPLLKQWIRFEVGSARELAEAVTQLKDLAAKFREWKGVAIQNNVTDFRKLIVAMEGARHINPIGIGFSTSKSEPALDITFVVQNDPEKASLQTGNFTWSPIEMAAFLRLVDQIDALVSQLPAEERRLQEERSNQVQRLQDVDALFR